MVRRKSISKSVRFEVFKRDSFTCQYCGKSAPDVVLEVDHIIPVSKGGDNDISNLITSCFDCNRGKSSKKLTDKQSIKLQKEELNKLNKRREQLQMMAEWRKELLKTEEKEIDILLEILNENLTTPFDFTEYGRKHMKKLIKKYGLKEIIECSGIAYEQYEDRETALDKIGAIAYMRALQKENPDLKGLYYIRGIIKNRLCYYDSQTTMILLKEARKYGASLESLKEVALSCRDWDDFKKSLRTFIENNE